LETLISRVFVIIMTLACLMTMLLILHIYANAELVGLMPENLSEFGDFFGGTLGPIFSLISFMALLYTIILQQKELSLTRAEMKRSADALDRTSSFSKWQNDISERQIRAVKSNEIKNDIYRLIQTSEDKINSILSRTVSSIVTGEEVPLSSMLNKIISNEDFAKAKCQEFDVEYGEYVSALSLELSVLRNLLEEFDKIAEHNYVSNYFHEVFEVTEKSINRIRGI